MANLGGEAAAHLEASIDELWPIVEDVASAPDWQQGLEALNVREHDGDGRVLLAESVSDAKVRTVSSLVRFSYVEGARVAWRQEKGDLKSLDGAWELVEVEAGVTRVTYRLLGDPGRMLGMLVRGPVEERLREILVGGRPAELAARAGVPHRP